MKRIMAVYDEDPFYADRFAEFANQSDTLPFAAVAFTSLARLKEYADQHPVEILLVGDETDLMGLQEIPVGQIMRLGESGLMKDQHVPVVYKYQASDSVLREVMACYQVRPEVSYGMALGVSCTIMGVYSPVGRCGKTGFALTLGQVMAKTSKVLFLSLEENSGLSCLTQTPYRGSLAELFYYFRQGQYSRLRLGAVTYNLGGMDYVPPVSYAEDLAEVSGAELSRFLRQVADDSGYDTLLIDFGRFGRGIEQVLELCSVIYAPVLEDCVSAARAEEWKQYLEISGRRELLDRIQWLKLPQVGGSVPAELYLEQLMWGGMGDYVRGLYGGQEVLWKD